MSITGSHEAFMEYMNHHEALARRPWLYTLTPQGRVKAVLFDSTEWNFLAQDNVQVADLKRFAVSAIEATSWTL